LWNPISNPNPKPLTQLHDSLLVVSILSQGKSWAMAILP